MTLWFPGEERRTGRRSPRISVLPRPRGWTSLGESSRAGSSDEGFVPFLMSFERLHEMNGQAEFVRAETREDAIRGDLRPVLSLQRCRGSGPFPAQNHIVIGMDADQRG